MKSRQFLKLLKAKGATLDAGRGKGGHVLVTLNGRRATVPSHGDTDFDPDFPTTSASSSEHGCGS